MTNQYSFCIRRVQNVGTETKCPACGDSFTTGYLAVHDNYGQPICELCAWEKDGSLASLIYLSDVAGAFSHAEPPPHIVEGIEKRREDPERIERQLKEAHKSLQNNGTGQLAELVAGQIKAALDSKKVETMKQAQRLLSETRIRVGDLDDEIPF